MIVQGTGKIAALYGMTVGSPSVQRQTPTEISPTDKVTLSAAAKSWSGSSNDGQEIQNRVKQIESKPATERTLEESEYISKYDARLNVIQAKIKEKGSDSLTSGEVDYMQKTGGFVNTMAYLSSSEKGLYDEMVAKGDSKAAQALLLIGMSRIGMEGQTITLPNGKTFDPTNTEVTAYSVRNLYKYLFVDPSGETDKKFDALASWLENRDAAVASKA